MEGTIQSPRPREWLLQGARRRVFNELAYNTDFNQGKQLIAKDWKIWLIDYTRAFGGSRKLFDPTNLQLIEDSLLERLRQLTPEALELLPDPKRAAGAAGAERRHRPALRARRRRPPRCGGRRPAENRRDLLSFGSTLQCVDISLDVSYDVSMKIRGGSWHDTL